MKQIHSSSFRDPSGHVFLEDGLLLRQVNLSYRSDYELLFSSGLYDTLTEKALLVPHKELDRCAGPDGTCYKTIQPEKIPFISYPYEWCFSQIKDAALTTLRIQKLAFERGMSLKDASPYNIQFYRGSPILIDTLSFEQYRAGEPWVAYRQFCQQFLAPLALISYTDARLNLLLREFIDGIPLDLASSLLPRRTCLRPSLFLHIHLHSRAQRRFARTPLARGQKKVAPLSQRGLIDNLESTIIRLKWDKPSSSWSDYYEHNTYTTDAFEDKTRVVASFLDRLSPKTVWDLGANQGVFSRLAAQKGINTVAYDMDMAAVEGNYLHVKANRITELLPLVLDLTNPSPGIGWRASERASLFERGNPDGVIALALIHHLAIAHNIPLENIARFMAGICTKGIIVEFVPKTDAQVQRMLQARQDIFTDYTVAEFENSFRHAFTITAKAPLRDSERVLYLMHRR